jgi:hypothetical protein
MKPIASAEEYQVAKERIERSKVHREKYGVGKHKTCIPADAPPDPADNEDRTLVEVYEFAHENTGADGHTGYVDRDLTRVTTFMGDLLATITERGPKYKIPAFGGFPSERRNFRARGIDGHIYAGVAYVSSGDYCRMRRVKVRRGGL